MNFDVETLWIPAESDVKECMWELYCTYEHMRNLYYSVQNSNIHILYINYFGVFALCMYVQKPYAISKPEKTEVAGEKEEWKGSSSEEKWKRERERDLLAGLKQILGDGPDTTAFILHQLSSFLVRELRYPRPLTPTIGLLELIVNAAMIARVRFAELSITASDRHLLFLKQLGLDQRHLQRVTVAWRQS